MELRSVPIVAQKFVAVARLCQVIDQFLVISNYFIQSLLVQELSSFDTELTFFGF